MKNNKKKKYVGLLLAIVFFVMPFANSFVSFKNLSYAEENLENNKIYNKTIPIEIDGKIFNIEVKSNFSIDENSDISFRSFTPEYEVGEKKHISFKITREMLGLSHSIEKVAVEQLSKVANKMAAKIIPGLNAFSIASIIGAGTMLVLGINGIEVNLTFEYVEHYYHMGGYNIYAWKFDDISFNPY